jgi:hypothetical protein
MFSSADMAAALQSALNLPVRWHLCGVALVVVLLILDRKSRHGGIVVIFIWNLVGVVLHELCHFVAGTLLFARPTGFTIIPRRQENGYRLGAVSFNGLNAFNSLPVALAPLGLIAAAFLVFHYWTEWFAPTLVSTLGMYLALFVLIYNSLPSWQDLKIAFGWKSIILYGTTSFLVCKYIVFRHG